MLNKVKPDAIIAADVGVIETLKQYSNTEKRSTCRRELAFFGWWLASFVASRILVASLNPHC